MTTPSNQVIGRALRTAAVRSIHEFSEVVRVAGGDSHELRRAYFDRLNYLLNGDNVVIDDPSLTRIIPDAPPENSDIPKQDKVSE